MFATEGKKGALIGEGNKNRINNWNSSTSKVHVSLFLSLSLI